MFILVYSYFMNRVQSIVLVPRSAISTATVGDDPDESLTHVHDRAVALPGSISVLETLDKPMPIGLASAIGRTGGGLRGSLAF